MIKMLARVHEYLVSGLDGIGGRVTTTEVQMHFVVFDGMLCWCLPQTARQHQQPCSRLSSW
jgi:hypothetical protein